MAAPCGHMGWGTDSILTIKPQGALGPGAGVGGSRRRNNGRNDHTAQANAYSGRRSEDKRGRFPAQQQPRLSKKNKTSCGQRAGQWTGEEGLSYWKNETRADRTGEGSWRVTDSATGLSPRCKEDLRVPGPAGGAGRSIRTKTRPDRVELRV